jgi:acetyl esterase/lipase
MGDVLRFLGGVLLFGLAALSLLPAPTAVLWHATIAATEWGYWIAFVAILPLVPTRNVTRLGKLGAILSLAAIGLFCLPILRAKQMNEALPAAFDARFGAERRERAHFAEDARAEPLVLRELLRPVQSPPIRFEERVFRSGPDGQLTLDIYRPAYEHGPIPGVVVIHGGSWQGGSNAEFVALNGYLAARDHVVAAISYRLAPRWPFPAARDDVMAAVAYLKAHAGEIGVDPSRLALLGRSAGGQLALLAAYTAGDPSIRGAISIYGPTDLRFGYEHPAPPGLIDTRGVLEAYLGGPPAGDDDAYHAASPINFVSAASPPTLLIHGLRDGLVLAEESARLEARLKEQGVKHLFVRLPWATHGCDRSFSGPCGQIVTYAIERFLDGVMAGPPGRQVPAARRASTKAAREDW